MEGGVDLAKARQESAPPEQTSREVTLDQFCFGFSVDITGDISASAQYGTLLAAKPGERWVLTGAGIYAYVSDLLAGSAGLLHLVDGTGSTMVAPLGKYGATDAAGTVLVGAADQLWSFAPGPEGIQSRAANQGLFVRGTATISGGNIIVAGWIRGRFVPGAP